MGKIVSRLGEARGGSADRAGALAELVARDNEGFDSCPQANMSNATPASFTRSMVMPTNHYVERSPNGQASAVNSSLSFGIAPGAYFF